MEIFLFVAGGVIWALALLLALDNMGVAIKPLLAGLGIGGIAVALAVQAVLGDLLASMSIAMDKPFVIGDLLTVDTLTGTVEYIGVKSTRIRSITGEQIVVANSDITKSRIRNFGRMSERRVSFEIPVIHDTPVATLRAIPEALRDRHRCFAARALRALQPADPERVGAALRSRVLRARAGTCGLRGSPARHHDRDAGQIPRAARAVPDTDAGADAVAGAAAGSRSAAAEDLLDRLAGRTCDAECQFQRQPLACQACFTSASDGR